MEMRRVVVTGLGSLTPIGNTVEEYWQGPSQVVLYRNMTCTNVSYHLGNEVRTEP